MFGNTNLLTYEITTSHFYNPIFALLVFDKFHRLPNTKAGGSGLGLSIVKGFVEANNGKVKLENTPPRGAKFTIEIPTETSFLNNLKNE